MQTTRIAMLFFIPVVALSAQQPNPSSSEATQLYQKAVAAYEEKDYAKSLELCQQALDKGAKRGTVPYHMACCYALTSKFDDAFKYLNLAIERGWHNVEHMLSDPDLNSLREDPRWPQTIKRCEQEREKKLTMVKEPALARELLVRMDKDQRARRYLEERMRNLPPGQTSVFVHDVPEEFNMQRIDQENTEFMRVTIEKLGWPGKSMVGEESAQAAWLLVQHADHDPDFQDKCLALIKEAFKSGDVTGQQVAYLTDRVLIKQGKKQLYGTQFNSEGSETNPFPIEDEANLDARRNEMGLGPMADYERIMRGQR